MECGGIYVPGRRYLQIFITYRSDMRVRERGSEGGTHLNVLTESTVLDWNSHGLLTKVENWEVRDAGSRRDAVHTCMCTSVFSTPEMTRCWELSFNKDSLLPCSAGISGSTFKPSSGLAPEGQEGSPVVSCSLDSVGGCGNIQHMAIDNSDVNQPEELFSDGG